MWAEISGWIATLASSPAINWKAVLIGGYILDTVFRVYLDFRQYQAQLEDTPPEEAVKERLVDHEAYRNAQSYERAKLSLRAAKQIFEVFVRAAVIKYDVWPLVFNFWKTTIPAPLWGRSKITGLLAFSTIQFVHSVLSKPFSYYRIFGIEERFGFNKSTTSLWIKDTLMTWVLNAVIIAGALLPAQAIIEYFGDSFVPYLGAFVAFFMILQSFILPTLVFPLFSQYTPLEDGELKDSIEKLAKSQNFAVKRIYVEDASVRSSHDNAYFIGYPWYKQIVIFDTMVKEYSVEEMTAVVAHELGHWKLNHTFVNLAIGELTTLPMFILLSAFINNASWYESLGFEKGDTPIPIALLVLVSEDPISTLFDFLGSYMTRCNEYAADRFAVSLNFGQSLRKGIIKMSSRSLTTLDNDTLYSTFHNDHPPLLDRIRAIDLAIKKAS